MAWNNSPRAYPDEFDGMDHADESIVRVKDDVKRQFAEAGLDDEQAKYNAQFLSSGLSTFAHRAGISTEALYRFPLP
jgi:hypothetical protein